MDYPISTPSVGLVDGKFVDENPLTGTPGSLIPAAWGNSVTQEILNVITAGGQLPSEVDLTQLLKAIRTIGQVGAGIIGTDTGIANAYAATYAPAIATITDQKVVRFKAANANTGASTFTPAPGVISAAPIVGGAHVALQGGEIIAGGDIWVEWNSSIGAGSWVLLHATGGGQQVPAASKALHAPNVAQFAGVLAAAGELKIPCIVGGVLRTFILKWGQASGASTYSITFPSAFPNACLWAGGFSNGGGGSAAAFCEVGIFSASTLPLYALQSGGVGSSQAQLRAVLWVAIGW